jgi:hypothetical protein
MAFPSPFSSNKGIHVSHELLSTYINLPNERRLDIPVDGRVIRIVNGGTLASQILTSFKKHGCDDVPTLKRKIMSGVYSKYDYDKVPVVHYHLKPSNDFGTHFLTLCAISDCDARAPAGVGVFGWRCDTIDLGDEIHFQAWICAYSIFVFNDFQFSRFSSTILCGMSVMFNMLLENVSELARVNRKQSDLLIRIDCTPIDSHPSVQLQSTGKERAEAFVENVRWMSKMQMYRQLFRSVTVFDETEWPDKPLEPSMKSILYNQTRSLDRKARHSLSLPVYGRLRGMRPLG